MTADDTDDELVFDLAADRELADQVGVPVAELYEVLGTGWSRARMVTDPDADPAGEYGRGYGPWYQTGHPVQLLVRVAAGRLELAAPRSAGFGDQLWLAPTDPAGVPLTDWRSGREVAAAIVTSRRRSFTWCRHCRHVYAPEGTHEPNLCRGCAEIVLGVLY